MNFVGALEDLKISGKSEAETVGKIINYNNIILETYSRNSYETSKNMPGVYDDKGQVWFIPHLFGNTSVIVIRL